MPTQKENEILNRLSVSRQQARRQYEQVKNLIGLDADELSDLARLRKADARVSSDTREKRKIASEIARLVDKQNKARAELDAVFQAGMDEVERRISQIPNQDVNAELRQREIDNGIFDALSGREDPNTFLTIVERERAAGLDGTTTGRSASNLINVKTSGAGGTTSAPTSAPTSGATEDAADGGDTDGPRTFNFPEVNNINVNPVQDITSFSSIVCINGVPFSATINGEIHNQIS